MISPPGGKVFDASQCALAVRFYRAKAAREEADESAAGSRGSFQQAISKLLIQNTQSGMQLT